MHFRTTGFVVLALTTTLFFANCASNSNYYSARPLGKGNLQGFATISHIQTENPDDTLVAAIVRPNFTIFELGAAVGVTNKLDIGIKYSFPLAGAVEARYNLLSTGEDKGFYLTPGLRGGYTSLPTDSGAEEDNQRIEIAVPLYVSYFPVEWLGLTVIPTYSFRFFVPSEADFYENLLGGNVNLRIGKKVGFVAEGAFHRNFRWGWTEVQVGGGLFLNFNVF